MLQCICLLYFNQYKYGTLQRTHCFSSDSSARTSPRNTVYELCSCWYDRCTPSRGSCSSWIQHAGITESRLDHPSHRNVGFFVFFVTIFLYTRLRSIFLLISMKHIFLYTSAIVLGTMTYSSISALSPVACTMEYAPVCGSVQVQCITIPCDPVRQTFSNTCMANAEGATNITTGECSNPGTITPPVIVGGDRDKYGCIGSAGYRWNSLLGECVRPWMTKTKVLTIGPDMTTCYGMVPYACMQIRQGHKVFPFYERVEGFDYATGSLYRLLVRVEKLENPPADASDTRYTFIKLLSKTSVIPQNPSTASGSFSRTQSLSGTSWTIESMN